MTNKMKRQSTEREKWEKIFANPLFGKGLTSKKYKELIPLNSKNHIIQLKMGKGLEETFFQVRHING